MKNYLECQKFSMFDNSGRRYEKIRCIFDHWSMLYCSSWFWCPIWNINLELTLANMYIVKLGNTDLNSCKTKGQRLKIKFMLMGSFSASTAWMKLKTNSDPNGRICFILNLSKCSKIWKICLRSETIWDCVWTWLKNIRNSEHKSSLFK